MTDINFYHKNETIFLAAMFSLTLITFVVGIAMTAGKRVPLRSSAQHHKAVQRTAFQMTALSNRFDSYMQDVKQVCRKKLLL